MRILGIAGSVRRGSHNRRLLRAAGDMLPPGVDFVEWDGLGGLPIFDEDLETTPPPAVQDFLTAVEEADGLLIATPEYNASVPGGLKNALDWASRPFPDNVLRDKPSAVIGASTGLFGAVWAQAETRKVLGAMGGRVVEAELPVPRAQEQYEDGRLTLFPEQSQQLEEILAELLSEVEQRSGYDREGAAA